MNKENQFITKLTKETLKKNITWDDYLPNSIEGLSDEKIISKIYLTNVKESNLRLYQYQFQNSLDEYEWFWTTRIRLEIIDSFGYRLYEFGYDYALSDLFDAVTKIKANVDDLIDNFLQE